MSGRWSWTTRRRRHDAACATRRAGQRPGAAVAGRVRSTLRAVLRRKRVDGGAAVSGAPRGRADPRLHDARSGRGFAHQYPRGLLPPADASTATTAKTFELPSAPAYGDLRGRMESEWMPEMQEILSLDTHTLPVIWDADFLYGPKTTPATTHTCCVRSTPAPPSPSRSTPCQPLPRPRSNGYRSGRVSSVSPV